ncbi:MAG: hypothetical protein WBM00_01260 [Solirubrobacterales bacterium]
MKVLAEISAQSVAGLRAGAVRGRDFEAFDSLLERLPGAASILVTGDPDGKRAAAVGLAATATAAGRRTALLECDLAAPALAGSLRLAAEPGLHEYLRREADVSGILQPVILAGPRSAGTAEPLVCIVAGRPSSNGENHLASEGFRHATEKLRAAYNTVVFDGPSLEGDMGLLHDAAARADVTLACIRRAEARGRASRRLQRELSALPCPFAGAVAVR